MLLKVVSSRCGSMRAQAPDSGVELRLLVPPGREDDGAAGSGFEPRAFSRAWIGKTTPRAAWYYACEIDVGVDRR